MRGVQFKPMPWLSVITAICTVILISLAVWQYQRLQWKTNLLAEVEAAVNAPPLTSLNDLRAAITKGEAVDFRRIEMPARLVPNAESKLVFYPQTGGIFWQGLSPVINENGRGDRSIIYAAIDIVKDENRNTHKPRPVDKIVGYVRRAHSLGTIEGVVKAKAQPEKNVYFKFNQTGDWGEALPPSADFFEAYYLESALGVTSAESLPIKRPKIRNNHFDYMLTWASFAIILLFIYAVLHVKAGRLGWQTSEDFGQS